MSSVTIPPASQWKRWVPGTPVLVAWLLLVLVTGFTYWSTLRYLFNQWWNVPDYGHGFFVPVFAGFLLWIRQEMVDPWPREGTWWAVPFFLVWMAARFAILYFGYERDADTLLPFLIGVTLFLGGWRALNWAWPAIVFLIFMIPLPMSLAVKLSQPLQRIATAASVYALQTLGVAAIVPSDQATVIQLPNSGHSLEVAQACCGLRMLMLFFALCVGAAFVMRVPAWQKILLVVSAIPISLLSNVGRITLDGVLTELVSAELGDWVHNNAGWLMMFPAMALIWAEMSLVSKLVLEVPEESPLMLGGAPTRAVAKRSRPPIV